MPRVMAGVLLTCDNTVKQIVLAMRERHGSMLVEDLDETHLFVTAEPAFLASLNDLVNKRLAECRVPKSRLDERRQ